MVAAVSVPWQIGTGYTSPLVINRVPSSNTHTLWYHTWEYNPCTVVGHRFHFFGRSHPSKVPLNGRRRPWPPPPPKTYKVGYAWWVARCFEFVLIFKCQLWKHRRLHLIIRRVRAGPALVVVVLSGISLLWTNIWTNLTLNAPPLIGWLLSLVPYYINRFHILVVLWCFLVAERERERGARVGDRVTDKWVDIKRQVAPYGKCVCVCSVLVVEYDNWWWLVFLVFFVTHYPPLTAPSVSPSSYSLLS